MFCTVSSIKPTGIIVEMSNSLFMQIRCQWISYLWPYMAIKMNRNSSKQSFLWFSKQNCGLSLKKEIEILTVFVSIRHALSISSGWHRVILGLWHPRWRPKWLTKYFRHYKTSPDNVFGTFSSIKATRIIVEMSNSLFIQIRCL